MGNTPASTLLFAALRRMDSERKRQVEDRCTEMLATLVANHDELAVEVEKLFGFDPLPDDDVRAVETQVAIVNSPGKQKTVDFAMGVDRGGSLDGSTHAHGWIEVKVDARPGATQFSDYHLASSGLGVKFGVLCRQDRVLANEQEVRRTVPDIENPNVHSWPELAAAFRKRADLPGYLNHATFSETQSDSLRYDVAQFLMYLSQNGLIFMHHPINASTLEIARDSYKEIHSLWGLFGPSLGAAGSRVLGVVDGGGPWSFYSISETKLMHEWAEGPSRVMVPWWWGAFGPDPEFSSGYTLDFSLTQGAWSSTESPYSAELGVLYGVTMEKKHNSEQELESRSKWFTNVGEELGFRNNQIHWGGSRRWCEFEPLSQIGLLELEDSEGQSRVLSEFLEARLRSMVESMYRHLPESESLPPIEWVGA